MGRLTRALAVALLAGLLGVGLLPGQARAFTGFGPMQADATYGQSMTFSVDLQGGAPERLELLLRFAGDEGVFVAPVEADGDTATYVWDAADRHVTPNTRITYSWRASEGDSETESRSGTLLYDDDRPGLDWQSARLGEVTIHWYGGTESLTRRLGDVAVDATARAEELLGHELAGPVDLFMYDSTDDFFGALGPGAREWTGAATYPALRTIFMQSAAGNQAYLETATTHEITHVVFNDATQNPFHEPAKWLNEGIAVWSEQQSAGSERSTVEFEASGGGLFSFDAISAQFPIGDRGARLAYAQGATMVDMIVSEHGRQAIAGIAAAYRDGASDTEALQAGTGRDADALFSDFFGAFDVEEPEPIAPAEIPPSNVRKPAGAASSPAPGSSSEEAPAPGSGDLSWLFAGGIAILVAVAGALVWAGRRNARAVR